MKIEPVAIYNTKSLAFQETKFHLPIRRIDEVELVEWKLRYYDAAVHAASFVLPRFASKEFFRE
jgi:spermidine synthase